jgi:hypothetical protein
MALDHPDPEGHLTDLTISELRDQRDSLQRRLDNWSESGDYWDGLKLADQQQVRFLDRILEPWGEGPIAEDGN